MKHYVAKIHKGSNTGTASAYGTSAEEAAEKIIKEVGDGCVVDSIEEVTPEVVITFSNDEHE